MRKLMIIDNIKLITHIGNGRAYVFDGQFRYRINPKGEVIE
jgi:hypothetical protein